jgi:tetratricopeptide (TPR) repeat protein
MLAKVIYALMLLAFLVACDEERQVANDGTLIAKPVDLSANNNNLLYILHHLGSEQYTPLRHTRVWHNLDTLSATMKDGLLYKAVINNDRETVDKLLANADNLTISESFKFSYISKLFAEEQYQQACSFLHENKQSGGFITFVNKYMALWCADILLQEPASLQGNDSLSRIQQILYYAHVGKMAKAVSMFRAYFGMKFERAGEPLPYALLSLQRFLYRHIDRQVVLAKNHDVAADYNDIFIDLDKSEPQIIKKSYAVLLSLLSEYLRSINKHQEAEYVLKTVLLIEPDWFPAIIRAYNIDVERKNYGSAYWLINNFAKNAKTSDTALKSLIAIYQADISNYMKLDDAVIADQISRIDDFANLPDMKHKMYYIQILLRLSQYQKSIDIVDQLLVAKEAEKLEDFELAFLHSIKGMAYERMADWGSAVIALERSLELDPDNPFVLNYLAYGWLERNMHIEQAHKMLKNAFATNPDNYHIVDSFAWSFYKQQNYDKALFFMLEAIKEKPLEPILLYHLGAIYQGLNRHIEAEYMWDRALIFIDVADDTDDVVTKIANCRDHNNCI